MLADLSVSSPPMEIRASTPIDTRASYTVFKAAVRLASCKCSGRETSLPGLVRAVPMMMPWLLRVRFNTLCVMRI